MITTRFALIIILISYLFVAGDTVFKFDLDHGGSNTYISYNHLAESFLSGKLYLKEADPAIYNLEKPFDPTTNYKFRWQDGSLYKGRYYFYFGPTPALILYLPFKFLTNMTLSDTFVSTAFSFGTVVWGMLILLLIKRRYFNNLPDWILVTSVFVLGLSSCGLYMVHKNGGVYTAAISSGCFFQMGAIYLFCSTIYNSKYSIKRLTLASLFLGLAGGSRAFLILSGILLLIISLSKALSLTEEKDFTSKVKLSFFTLMPWFTCLILLGIYNYLRFDDPFEFGFTYQTGDFNIATTKLFSPDYILKNLYLNLLHPPYFNSIFPYFHVNSKVPGFISSYLYIGYFGPLVGLFTGTPYICVLFLCWFLNKSNRQASVRLQFPKFETGLIGAALVYNLCFNLLFFGASMRFVTEISYLFILVASIFWFYHYSISTTKLQKRLNYAVTTLAIISILLGSCSGIDTAKDKQVRVNEIKTIESFFSPLSDFLFKLYPDWDSVLYRAKKLNVKSDYSDINFALDNNLGTDWKSPAKSLPVITFKLDSPSNIKGLWLLSRETKLYEGWKTLVIELYVSNSLILKETFHLQTADKKRIQHIKLNSKEADSIIISFLDPVSRTIKGKEVDPNTLGSGYTEILFEGA